MAKVASGGQPFSIAVGQQIAGEIALAKVLHVPSAAAQGFLLNDVNGKTIVQELSSGAGAKEYLFPTPISVVGLGCAVLTAGGQLFVYMA